MEFIKQMFKKKQTIPQPKDAEIVDYVKLGEAQSERHHEGLFSWGEIKEHISSNYGADDYNIFSPKRTSVRNYAGLAGVKLTLKDPSKQNYLLYISLYDTPYEVGMMKFANKETTVLVSADGKEWKEVGKLLLSYEEKMSDFEFEIMDFEGNLMYIQLNNGQNLQDGQNHYGQSVHFIGIYKKQ